MQSIVDKIITSISKRGRGTIVSPLDYAGYGDSKAVQKKLSPEMTFAS